MIKAFAEILSGRDGKHMGVADSERDAVRMLARIARTQVGYYLAVAAGAEGEPMRVMYRVQLDSAYIFNAAGDTIGTVYDF